MNIEDLTKKLEKLRKELCTGPCGQSSSVLDARSERNRLLRETIAALNESSDRVQLLENIAATLDPGEHIPEQAEIIRECHKKKFPENYVQEEKKNV